MAKLSQLVVFLLKFAVSYCLAQHPTLRYGTDMEIDDPFVMNLSPGFLNGAFPYVGQHDCTESGTCKHIPFSCPSTSCCLPGAGTTNGVASSTSSLSHCGCWDSTRNKCDPIRSFRLGWTSCNSTVGKGIRSDLEIAYHPSGTASSCRGGSASVNFVTTENGQVEFSIRTSTCRNKHGRIGKVAFRNEDITFGSNVGPITLQIQKLIKLFGKASNHRGVAAARESIKSQTLVNLSGDTRTGHDKDTTAYLKYSEPCYDDSGSAVLSMCPGFLPGVVDKLPSLGYGNCGTEGQCRISSSSMDTRTCPGNITLGCCILSKTEKTACKCIPSVNSCLELKLMQIGWKACTKGGNTVVSKYNVNLLSTGQICERKPDYVEQDILEDGSILFTIHMSGCLLSSSGFNYVHVDQQMSVRITLDTFLPTLKAVLSSMTEAERRLVAKEMENWPIVE